ncbi:MAG: DUF4339 domain-containing protein [Verrucomicrobiae bacterium]
MKQYHIDRDGQRYGPFSADQIIEMLQSNQLSLLDNCWHEGLPAWLPLSDMVSRNEFTIPLPLTQMPVYAKTKPIPSDYKKRMSSRQLFFVRYLLATIGASVIVLVAALIHSPNAFERTGLSVRGIIELIAETTGRLLASCLVALIISPLIAGFMVVFKKSFWSSMSYTYSACVLLAAGFGLLTGIISRNHKPAFSFVLISNTTKTGLTNDAQYENTLWIKFVPVTGTDVLFSVWDTRVKDFAAFVSATTYNASTGWKKLGFQQTLNDPPGFLGRSEGATTGNRYRVASGGGRSRTRKDRPRSKRAACVPGRPRCVAAASPARGGRW